ncbi:DUF397 domain-containing protein [Streptomyces roseoverticillatus]|uniref:DUF397 domain-containing protein n=1 Tax=Streptomyces roseoverticillatus TaxID=66429 RepID=UPI001F2E61FC|nr:DUF397 domain-containing protein [Streptomyces roseoverticillatus]MCF3105569.1 DUF397 domain-containing protein [Streptomyces roseoverticillatus]
MKYGPIWLKSSYSDNEGAACVEVALPWRKSSYSQGEGGQCVEISALPQAIRIRDSKRKGGPQLAVGAPAWEAFVAYAPAAAR